MSTSLEMDGIYKSTTPESTKSVTCLAAAHVTKLPRAPHAGALTEARHRHLGRVLREEVDWDLACALRTHALDGSTPRPACQAREVDRLAASVGHVAAHTRDRTWVTLVAECERTGVVSVC